MGVLPLSPRFTTGWSGWQIQRVKVRAVGWSVWWRSYLGNGFGRQNHFAFLKVDRVPREKIGYFHGFNFRLLVRRPKQPTRGEKFFYPLPVKAKRPCMGCRAFRIRNVTDTDFSGSGGR